MRPGNMKTPAASSDGAVDGGDGSAYVEDEVAAAIDGHEAQITGTLTGALDRTKTQAVIVLEVTGKGQGTRLQMS